MDFNLMGLRAKESARALRQKSTQEKNKILLSIANAIDENRLTILSENEKDISKARNQGLSEALLERLMINEKRIDDMIASIHHLINLDDPIGEVPKMWVSPDGLNIGEKRVPIGVIGIIYESRPNVTVEASTLCIKTGNAVILKGGSDALGTNMAIIKAIAPALESHNLPYSVQLIGSTDRKYVKTMLEASDSIDCIIPRGGSELIKFVVQHSKVPVIETGAGNCHIYVDRDYEIQKAISIILNAKLQRPGACNAVETLLIHEEMAPNLLPQLLKALSEKGVSLYLCSSCMTYAAQLPSVNAEAATEEHWYQEFLDFKLAIKQVRDIDEAIGHIERYSTKHSEAILTNCYESAQTFLSAVDSAAVYVNASTRFTDGSAFGFGAEIGISTQKLHARGPMGLKALTSSKYVIYGAGQVRP